MQTSFFPACFLAFLSLLGLSISDRCNGGSKLHIFNDSERCCQPVTVPPGHERRICKEENGKAEYAPCSSHSYQSYSYPSFRDRSCKRHSKCKEPNLVVDVPGNSTSNTVCKCNEDEGYKATNEAGGTAPLELYHCLPDGSNESRKEISNITSTTTESPSNTTETAASVSHSVAGIIVGIIALIAIIIIAAFIFFIVKKRRQNNYACQQFRRNQQRPNGAQIPLDIEAAVDGENCSLDHDTEATDGHEEGDAMGNGHVISNGACLLSTPSPNRLPEADERQNAVGNGLVTSNGTCLHRTPLLAGLSETDDPQYIFDLQEDNVDSSLCEQSNS